MKYFPVQVAGAAFFRSEINSYLSISVIASISGTSWNRQRITPDTQNDA